MSVRQGIAAVVGCTVVMVVSAGCGGGSDTATTTTTASTITQTAEAPAPAETPAATTNATTEMPTTTEAPTAATKTVLMPNVVCMNLQAAQNKIQDAGVFFSRSVDASGQGRSQILDRNWIVVAQTPDPGTLIGEGDAVLSAVKIGEPNPC